MWRWYLNSDIQPYNYSQRLHESGDGTRIKARQLGLHVEGGDEAKKRDIKKKDTMLAGGGGGEGGYENL